MTRMPPGTGKPVPVANTTLNLTGSMKTGSALIAEDAMSEQTDMFGVRRNAKEKRSREIQKREIEKMRRVLQGDKKRHKNG